MAAPLLGYVRSVDHQHNDRPSRVWATTLVVVGILIVLGILLLTGALAD